MPIVRDCVKNVELSYNRLVKSPPFIGGIASAIAAVAAVTAMGRLLTLNATTAALLYLLVVLSIAASWGLRVAAPTSVLATLAFNYFFLPPVGTFTIAEPQNWVALFAFLVTAVIASRLAEKARRETLKANQRRVELEQLYEFCQILLATENSAGLLNVIPGYLVGSFGVATAALFVPQRKDIYRSQPSPDGIEAQDLQMACLRGEPILHPERPMAVMPLRLGAKVVGSIGLTGPLPSRSTLEALSSVIGIAIERAGAVEKLAHTEAARESETLRTVLLDSVAHEFRTPLTAIKAAVTSLLGEPQVAQGEVGEMLLIINEESDRLNRLVGAAAEMAQLAAGDVHLDMRPHPLRPVIEAALAAAKSVLSKHPVTVTVPDNLPVVTMDGERIAEVIQQLVENAARYSPADSPIQISAEVRNQQLMVSVADQGSGIEDLEQSLIFQKFYRGKNQRLLVAGTGMGLPISKAIIEAHGGSIAVTSQPGRGSVFYFLLKA